MRNGARTFFRWCLLVAALLVGGAGVPACGRRPGLSNGATGNGGGGGGAGAAAGMAAPCAGASDERLVVAGQRVLRLTMNETLNTVRYLIDDAEAAALVRDLAIGGDSLESNRQFPPLIVNGYEVTFTVEEATSYAVEALLSSPQMLWRWELGDPAPAAAPPAGILLTDGCGNNLLDFTCVPFLTEVRTNAHERSNMAAMLIGGKQLGFVHDRYVAGTTITVNQLWGTIAQAFGYSSTEAPFAAPVAGFWAQP
jgi:hypothetical protein